MAEHKTLDERLKDYFQPRPEALSANSPCAETENWPGLGIDEPQVVRASRRRIASQVLKLSITTAAITTLPMMIWL